MDYLLQLFSKAWNQTWSAVFNSPPVTVLLAAIIFAVSTAIHWHWKGFSDVKDALIIGIEGAVATVIVLILVFAFHFLFLTPYRLFSREHSARVIAERNSVLSQLYQGTTSVRLFFKGGFQTPEPINQFNVENWHSVSLQAISAAPSGAKPNTLIGPKFILVVNFYQPIDTNTNNFPQSLTFSQSL